MVSNENEHSHSLSQHQSDGAISYEQWVNARVAANDWLRGFAPMDPDDRSHLSAGIAKAVLSAAGLQLPDFTSDETDDN